jgi:Epoxide hydrolase N terminus
MSNPQFGKLPEKASSSIQPFTIDLPESEIKSMIDLLKLTPVASSLYENSLLDGDRHLGIRRDWLLEAKKYWEETYDWFASPICPSVLPREYSQQILGRSVKPTSIPFRNSRSPLPTN